MERRSIMLAVAAVLPLTVAACEALTEAEDCTADARAGIRVEVRDSISGQVATAGATLLVVSGAYRDSLSYPETISPDYDHFASAIERPGVYLVTVKKSGYADWRNAAWVRDGACHVRTVRLVARLQRL